MNESKDIKLREQLVKHLKGGEAFTPVDEVLDRIPFDQLGMVPEQLPYSFYQLFYHIRLAQHDILEFSRDPDYKSPDWPDGYWPEHKAPENKAAWQQLKTSYLSEREAFCALIMDPQHDLFKPFRWGSGQTLLREALLVIEHTAYHSGQLLVVLRLLGLYPA